MSKRPQREGWAEKTPPPCAGQRGRQVIDPYHRREALHDTTGFE
jgi:hypothetical protein